jgi:hypothetical protein
VADDERVTGHAITPAEHRLFRHVPITQKAARASIYWARESYALGFVKRPGIMTPVQRIALRHLYRQVSDPALRADLTPAYRMGCKRVLISNDFYPALTQPNVSVVTDGIAEIRDKSIVTRDGTEHEVDTIIFGTGFHVTDFPVAQRIYDASGRALAGLWSSAGSAGAFRGTTTPRGATSRCGRTSPGRLPGRPAVSTRPATTFAFLTHSNDHGGRPARTGRFRFFPPQR